MTRDLASLPRHGDKKNSPFFEEYLPRIYARRQASGLDDLLTKMRAVLVQVSTGDALPYLVELYTLTPYRVERIFLSASHRVFALGIRPELPRFLLLEPREPSYGDEFRHLNELFPNSRPKPNARYLGEIFQTADLNATREILGSQHVLFQNPARARNELLANPRFAFTEGSVYTRNVVAYSEADFHSLDELDLGEPSQLGEDERAKLDAAAELSKRYELRELVSGIDHLAARVLSSGREDAILEWLTCSNHYFWGAYTIDDMNSSTNITRNPTVDTELYSPAKVFTANNVPYYVNSFENRPMPTEEFVLNYGQRMHHMAYEVVDGVRPDGTKNIDYVVNECMAAHIKFLADIIGECSDAPDLKQIFSRSSPYSLLITEYVERCHGFAGFFTKSNVAALTAEAGLDEQRKG